MEKGKFRQFIKIRGANEHNLNNISVDIPRNELVVLTGLSGSGKSSLAFDTIYAEGQRRYMESLSSYARQFLGQMEKPNVESIEGLSPAISIDQKSTNRNPRSTVGTVTEIYDYFRLLYARVGIPHCPKCGREIKKQTVDQMVDVIMQLPERTKIQLLAPVVRGRKGEHVKLFEQAKKSAPCIVFIDEIDAVARRRGTGMGGGHDEREQTLNQLLVEMDGFGVNEGIIVMAATNRVDILDPAILRPGRFDRKVAVGTPDIGGREEILKVHAKNKPLGDDVNLQQIAQTTAGFTGADLENLLNEAAIIAAKENRSFIAQKDIKRAFIKVGIGAEKKSRIISDKEKKITAYHEAGHAVTSYYLEHKDPVTHISIVPRGMAGGFTMYQPEKDEMHLMKSRMLDDIVGLLGGRVAEKIIFNDISTGASNDIERASDTARKMITKYGMSEKLGPITFGTGNDEVFLGKDYNHMRNYSEAVACEIDEEVEKIILKAYDRTESILNEHIDKLHAVAKALVEREKIDAEQFKILMEGGTLPPYEPKSEKAENKTETVEKDKPSAVDDKNADEAVKDLEDNFNDEKKYLTKDVASEAEKEVDSDEKKNSSDETGKEN